MFGPRKVDQFGWGIAGMAVPELTIGAHFGVELSVGGLDLSPAPNPEPGLADADNGWAFFVLPGVRVVPFGRDNSEQLFSLSGLWLAAGVGIADTGGLPRAALALRLGYDLTAGPFRLGPYGGMLQIIETSNEVMPEDARIALIGLHGSFDFTSSRTSAPVEPEPASRPDKPPSPTPSVASSKQPSNLIAVAPCIEKDPHDTDGDGIANKKDACPEDPETFNNYADDDGCPDADKVRVLGDEIILDERVYFRVNHAKVLPRSWPLIENVGKLLKANPQYSLVKVQGHADDRGEKEYNQELSLRRGMEVIKMLVRLGVSPARLTLQGFGETQPADPDKTTIARRKNRRVEFHILQRTVATGSASEEEKKDSNAATEEKRESTSND